MTPAITQAAFIAITRNEAQLINPHKTVGDIILTSKLNILRTGVAAAVFIGTAAIATPALAEISVSAAAANMYLWRGIDLGNGDAAISGDIIYSNSGAYGGVWASSGDAALGNEYDYFIGYGNALNDFSYDISLWNYNYSDNDHDGSAGFERSDDTTGELSEVILTLGYKDISFSYYDNIAGNTGYEYFTLSGGTGKFGATIGYHEFDTTGNGNDMTHLDVSYSFNDNLSFTASKIVAQDCDKDDSNCAGSFDEDLKLVVSYSLPIEL